MYVTPSVILEYTSGPQLEGPSVLYWSAVFLRYCAMLPHKLKEGWSTIRVFPPHPQAHCTSKSGTIVLEIDKI